ncbi:hypothetical protein [Shewanella algae]|uniref:hypothetical protein n=1 Tax=Shewanella algae TaxID=38313 RepID=UPI0031F5A683
MTLPSKHIWGAAAIWLKVCHNSPVVEGSIHQNARIELQTYDLHSQFVEKAVKASVKSASILVKY